MSQRGDSLFKSLTKLGFAMFNRSSSRRSPRSSVRSTRKSTPWSTSMPYKRRKSNVDDSKEHEKRSYIIGFVKRASVAQLKELNKHIRLESNEAKFPKNFFKLQERLINYVKEKDTLGIKMINRIYDVLPPSY
jgi:hypothetical protein